MESKDFEDLKKEYIKGYKKRLISRFEDMSKRETLLIGSNVTQEDLLMQLIGTIVKTDQSEIIGGNYGTHIEYSDYCDR